MFGLLEMLVILSVELPERLTVHLPVSQFETWLKAPNYSSGSLFLKYAEIKDANSLIFITYNTFDNNAIGNSLHVSGWAA